MISTYAESFTYVVQQQQGFWVIHRKIILDKHLDSLHLRDAITMITTLNRIRWTTADLIPDVVWVSTNRLDLLLGKGKHLTRSTEPVIKVCPLAQ
jgi:hypothetical protein